MQQNYSADLFIFILSLSIKLPLSHSVVQISTTWVQISALGMSEGYLIYDFTSLPLEIIRPILHTLCTKVAIKYQTFSHTVC